MLDIGWAAGGCGDLEVAEAPPTVRDLEGGLLEVVMLLALEARGRRLTVTLLAEVAARDGGCGERGLAAGSGLAFDVFRDTVLYEDDAGAGTAGGRVRLSPAAGFVVLARCAPAPARGPVADCVVVLLRCDII